MSAQAAGGASAPRLRRAHPCPHCPDSFVKFDGLRYHLEHTHPEKMAMPSDEVKEHGYKGLATAVDICTEAARLVGGDRQVTHGDKAINFANTAAMWNAVLQAKFSSYSLPMPITLTALDAANMLEAFKIARRYSGKHNPDDYVDGAGYAGCAGEIAGRES